MHSSPRARKPVWQIHLRLIHVLIIQIDGDVGTVGITSHAADALGDVVFVDLPAIGKKFVASDSFGSVESVKAASDVYSPVAGEVLEVNSVSSNYPVEKALFCWATCTNNLLFQFAPL